MTWNLSLEFCDNSLDLQIYFVNDLLQTAPFSLDFFILLINTKVERVRPCYGGLFSS